MRTKFKIKIGEVFNRLTVLEESEPIKDHGRIITQRFLCLCACGNKTVVNKGNLYRGTTKSCGCWKVELNHSKFGFRTLYPELYRKYKSAKSRCNNPNSASFKNYGGRGIKFLFEHGYVDFSKYCLEMGWKPGLQIDRIDNNGHYEKGNIRFVTHAENQKNKRPIKSIAFL